MKKIVKIIIIYSILLAFNHPLFPMEADSLSTLTHLPELTGDIFLYAIQPILKEKFAILINKHNHENGFNFLEALKEWYNYKLRANELYSSLPTIFSSEMLESQNQRLVNKINKMWSSLMIDFIKDQITTKDWLNIALLYGTSIGNIDIVQLAINKGADIDATDPKISITMLYNAPTSSCTESTITFYPSAAMIAAICGHLNIMRLLLEKNAHFKNTENNGTLLTYAASNGRIKIVKLLIRNGVNINEKDDFGNTPLMCALKGGYRKIADLLLEHCSDMSAKDQDGTTILMRAARIGHIKTVQQAIAEGVDINAKNANHTTALMEAAEAGHTDIVRLLLENDANINAIRYFDETAFLCAAKRGNNDVIRLFLEHRDHIPDITHALFLATKKGYTNTVRLLIENGADANATDYKGKTPLMHAIELGHDDIRKFLTNSTSSCILS